MDLILLHGMGRTPLSMLLLRYRLKKRGHNAYLFGYSPTFESLQGASNRLLRLVRSKSGSKVYVLVGHSLGSVIIRHALAGLADHPPSACYFLAPPMVACKAARFFSRFWLYRLITGEMGQLLAQEKFMQQLPLPEKSRIYAGFSGPRASWLPFGNEPNDGILSIAEATGAAHDRVVKVPSTHTFIMNSKVVFNDMAAALVAGAHPSSIENTQSEQPASRDN
jgi:hypothetical protein